MAEHEQPGDGADPHSPQSQHRALYEEYAARSDFLELKRRYQRFAFPATNAFMLWYVTYVICNNWARGFMDTPVIGNVNVAVVFGLLQFVSTFSIAYFYARHASSALDPLAARLQDEFERAVGSASTGSGPAPGQEAGR